MKKAIRSGFNPFNNPVFKVGAFADLFGSSEEDKRYYYEHWRNSMLKDNTDWFLCKSCMVEFNNVTKLPSLYKSESVMQKSKKWWQIWK